MRFLRCANLILPWLTPQELAVVSPTCKTFALRRSVISARPLENLPLPFSNDRRRPPLRVLRNPRQVTQEKISFRLKIITRDEKKGWWLYA
ncbi:PREDICTED: LOW QUALITY PROTEIN: histone-lysine N-methyltransferase SUVR3 [Tarenaya hassleriana]|uniref:LOW QUALITY PROTEIN: histone-lysine N-methyltransferase SUVR3 n=1 Tax=Tarenaya hassleriana TaxID=28532 RepID=UPI0008FD124E|nr:PREDICTED: LOW QUALITY PROTEIN: histone-lysine N-methyltransferase SUVR3 [Tarenaya hassleriana]